MKKIYFVVLLFWGSLTACNDWLDVTPSYQMDAENAFTNADGYNTALRGLYQIAAGSSLYGNTLSWGLLSGMAQEYEHYYANDRLYGARFDYTSSYTKPLVDGVWVGLYNIIANANLILNNIKNCDPGLFILDTLERDRIYGEALGMRAIMHLDVVRLFAPAPSSTGGKEKLVPYQDKWPSEFTVPKTTMETLDLIIADLEKAKDMLAPYDTLYKTARTNWANDQYIFTSGWGRGYQLNYPAVVCYLSRAYMYKGDYTNALYYADHFYKRFTYAGRKGNALCIFGDGTAGGQYQYVAYKAMQECPFALYQPDLIQWLQNYDNYGYNLPFAGYEVTPDDVLNVRFGSDLDDIRYNQFEVRQVEDAWQEVWEMLYTKRYDSQQHPYHDIERLAIPMIRMSEMYYNMIECYYREGNTTEAIRLLNEWRKGKQMSRTIDAETVLTLQDLQDIIINDARREYVTEGEVFHICKRMNRPLIDNMTGDIVPISDSKVTFPIPESQDL